MKQIAILCILFTNLISATFYFIDNKTEHGFLKPSFIKAIVDEFKPDIFIETGTYSGDTTLNAAPFFKEIHTIEFSKSIFNKTKERFKKKSTIKAYNGNSAELLPRIIAQCKGTILFWLDAHYSGEGTAMSTENPNHANAITAIREEMAAIAQSQIQDCVILIDDMRGFGSRINDTEFLGCWAYPTIQEVCAMGHLINKNFACMLLGDSLLLYDKTKFSPQFSPVVKACTLSRLYDGTNFSEDELLAAETTIMASCTHEEHQFIKYLYNRMTHYKDPLFHHDLWYALICMGSKQWKEAKISLSKVPERVEYLNTSKQEVHNVVRYNPSRFESYFKIIESRL